MTDAPMPPEKRVSGGKFFDAPVWSIGFRPFYFGAAVFAALAVPLWVAHYTGVLFLEGYMGGATWHAHEMLFGFAPAVIAGFLFTAVQNWTGQPLPRKGVLAGFVGLWIAGRILMVTGPTAAAFAVDVLFLPAVAFAVAIPIIRTRNYRNLFAPGILLVLAAANVVFHLAVGGLVPAVAQNAAVTIVFDTLTILMAVIAGRVIPMFTRNAVPGAAPRRIAYLEIAALGALGLILFGDLAANWLGGLRPWIGAIAGLAAVLHVVRLALWSPLSTWREPLLWILPLSYFWIAVSLGLRSAASLTDVVPLAISYHVLGVGAMGGLMAGMMARSARGHTGRALKAGLAETAIFILIQLAVLVRVLPAFVAPDHYVPALMIAAGYWSCAFLIFAIRYWPILTRARVA